MQFDDGLRGGFQAHGDGVEAEKDFDWGGHRPMLAARAAPPCPHASSLPSSAVDHLHHDTDDGADDQHSRSAG
jgi:hypothetical protein